MTFTPQEVASVAGVTVATIIRHIKQRKLKAHRTRGYVVEAIDLRDYLSSRLTERKATA
jgi:excisionase family DNA binding protein